MTTAKPLSTLLNNADERLNTLRQHCQLLQVVTKLVHQRLPAPLAEHCQVANLSGDRLILQTDSPAWNTLLRYQIPQLLEQLQRSTHLEQLKSIRVRTAPATQAGPSRRHTTPRQLNPGSAALIMSLATTINNPRLKASLQRLASRNSPS